MKDREKHKKKGCTGVINLYVARQVQNVSVQVSYTNEEEEEGKGHILMPHLKCKNFLFF